MIVVEKNRSQSFSDKNGARRISGLISPRFMPTAPTRHRLRRFRGLSGEVPTKDEELAVRLGGGFPDDELDVDIVDVVGDQVEEVSPSAYICARKLNTDGSLDKVQSNSSPSLKIHHRHRKGSDASDDPERKKERDRSSTVACESEAGRFTQDTPECSSPMTSGSSSSSSFSEHSESSQPFIPPLPKNLSSLHQADDDADEEQPSTSRRARQRTLQRSVRMSPQEIRSVMNGMESPREPVGFRKLAPESISTDLGSPHFNPPYAVKGTTPRYTPTSSSPLLATKVLGGSSGMMISRCGCDEAISPLCTPRPPAPSTTPRGPTDASVTPTRIVDVVVTPAHETTTRHSFRGSDKPRIGHARFFSTSTSKLMKPEGHPEAEKKVNTNPSSPVVGKYSSPSTPDLRASSMTLEEVVKDPELCKMFMEYLERLNASEGLEFLVKLESLRGYEGEPGINPMLLHKKAEAMCEQFIREGSEKELNLSHFTREAIEAKIAAPDASSLAKPSDIFQEARVEVFNMLGTNMYSQWVASLH